MKYFAHTYQLPDGTPDRNESHWQPLREHLENVAKKNSRPFRVAAGRSVERGLRTFSLCCEKTRGPGLDTLVIIIRRCYHQSSFLSACFSNFRRARDGVHLGH